MSRSDASMPRRIQEADGVPWQQAGGTWRGLRYVTVRRHRATRARTKRLLRGGVEPAPDQTRHTDSYYWW